MKKKVYVVLFDSSEELGEGYYSSSYNQFVSVEPTFEKARNVIEKVVQRKMDDSEYESEILDADGNHIEVEIGDTWYRYFFNPIEIEVEAN